MICICGTSNCDCSRSCICNPSHCSCSVCRHLRKATTCGEPSELYASLPVADKSPATKSGVRSEAQTHESKASGDDLLFQMEDINLSVESRRSSQSVNPTSQASSVVGSETNLGHRRANPDYLSRISNALLKVGMFISGIDRESAFRSLAHATRASSNERSNKPKTSSGSSSIPALLGHHAALAFSNERSNKPKTSSDCSSGEPDYPAAHNLPFVTSPESVRKLSSRESSVPKESSGSSSVPAEEPDFTVVHIVPYVNLPQSVRKPPSTASNILKESSGSSSVLPGESSLTAARTLPNVTSPESVTKLPSRAKDENAKQRKTSLIFGPQFSELIDKMFDYVMHDSFCNFPFLFGTSFVRSGDSMRDINPPVESRRSSQSINSTSQTSSVVGNENRLEHKLVNPDNLSNTSTSLSEFGSCGTGIYSESSFHSSAHATGSVSKNSNKPKTSSGSSSTVPPAESGLAAAHTLPSVTSPASVTKPPSIAKDKNTEEMKTGLTSKPSLAEEINQMLDHYSVDLPDRFPGLFCNSVASTSGSSNIPLSSCENTCTHPHSFTSEDLHSAILNRGFRNSSESIRALIESLAAYIYSKHIRTSKDQDLEDSSTEKSNNSSLAELIAAYISPHQK